jgi:hypothetical protein
MMVYMRSVSIILCAWCWSSTAAALDHIAFRRDERESHVSGRMVVKAEDGGLMLMSADGRLWLIEPDELLSHRTDEAPFVPQTADEAARAALAELPAGFQVFRTAHYVICYDTSRAYAQWCGALFERLYSGFINFWTNKGLSLHDPELPLVCVLFADQATYKRHTSAELGENAPDIVAYYSLKTNRVTMFDLTGIETLRRPSDRRGTSAEINQMLSRPDAASMVATIIHEATHQIAYNCGMHQRFADVPLWLSEGIAMYFEPPDLSSGRGWKTMGQLNRPRLARLRDYGPHRPPESLHTLIVDDKRLRDPPHVVEAYAEAWALNYFLIRQKPKEYATYLQKMATKPPLVWDEPTMRLDEFKTAFGPLEELDADFARFMQKLR